MTAVSGPSGTGPVLDIRDLSVAYRTRGGRHPAVNAVIGVDLTVAAGETVAVVGESGSGKSTIAAAVLGLLPAAGAVTGGSIEVAGRAVVGAGERQLRAIRGRVVALVPQDPNVSLNPTLRIGPQIAEAVRRRLLVKSTVVNHSMNRSVDAEVIAALEAAGLDEPALRARQYPHELSGGMRQRVLIAAALAGSPRLLVADEPTSALDVTVQKRILDHLQRLVAERGISLLLITHDLGVAADRADRVLVMQAGRLVEQGPPQAILVAPQHPYTRALIEAAPGLSDSGRVVPRFTEAPAAEEILRIENVVKDFPLPRSSGSSSPVVRALDDVSFSVRAGQTLALVGESGSGKTTALRIALGLEKPSAGRVFFEGQDITGQGWRQLRPLRRRFQLVHQNPFSSLDPKFTVLQTITEPLVSFGVGDRGSRRERAGELLDQVDLPRDYLTRRPAELSGGQRQRVAIARALALRPDLILLDEPVSALDVRVQEQILQLLVGLQRDLGVSYLFISHDLAVVAQVSHQVAVLRRGRIVEQGNTASVFDQPQSEYTHELLNAIAGQRRAVALAATAGSAVPAATAVPAGSAPEKKTEVRA
jgi:peptide/nickel transport system ATP-binding protein